MYQLVVRRTGEPGPVETATAASATEVLSLIPKLLDRYPDCERIEIMAGVTRLFAVDCEGARIPD